MTDESVCLDLLDKNEMKAKVKVMACSGSPRQKWMYDKNVSVNNDNNYYYYRRVYKVKNPINKNLFINFLGPKNYLN